MTMNDDAVLARAREILFARCQTGKYLTNPDAVRDYLTVKLADRSREFFGCVWLSARHAVIADDELFVGTLTQTSVYPREVVKAALAHNAGAAVLYHNHPSGDAEPSAADERLTKILRKALALVDVRVLDHVVVGGMRSLSFAERGLL